MDQHDRALEELVWRPGFPPQPWKSCWVSRKAAQLYFIYNILRWQNLEPCYQMHLFKKSTHKYTWHPIMWSECTKWCFYQKRMDDFLSCDLNPLECFCCKRELISRAHSRSDASPLNVKVAPPPAPNRMFFMRWLSFLPHLQMRPPGSSGHSV